MVMSRLPKTEVKMLVYEDTPRYDWWLKFALGVPLLVLLGAGIVLWFEDREASLIMFGVTVFDTILFRAILPRRFQIFEDRVKIVLGSPFAVSLSLGNIKEARQVPGSHALASSNIRFATSTHNVVEIVRKKGTSVLISPTHVDTFLELVNQAIAAA
jgi:hypothetical protein